MGQARYSAAVRRGNLSSIYMSRYESETLSFDYLSSWALDQDDEVLSLYEPLDGVGTLQFTVYNRSVDKAMSGEDLLEEFLADRFEYPKVEHRPGSWYAFLVKQDGSAWRYWLFATGDTLIFATYNCAVLDIEKEDSIVDAIIESAIEETK